MDAGAADYFAFAVQEKAVFGSETYRADAEVFGLIVIKKLI